jgi:hypothetical protein
MPTQADTFVILLIVIVVLWAARMGTLGDLVGLLVRRFRPDPPPPGPTSSHPPE